jgi:hypothetical protein
MLETGGFTLGPSHILKCAATGVEPASRAKRALGSCCKFPMVLLDSLLIKGFLTELKERCLRISNIHYNSLMLYEILTPSHLRPQYFLLSTLPSSIFKQCYCPAILHTHILT